MNAKKLFLYAAMAMILGAWAHHVLAADQAAPPLLDLKAEAKAQALKDSKGKMPSEGQAVSVTATKEAADSHAQKATKTTAKPKPYKVKHPHWSHGGKDGPAHWGDLSESYATCKTGRNQSPINLIDDMAVGTTDLPGFDVYYNESYLKIINNGHTVQVNYPLGNSYLKIHDRRYELLQFHFHTPSEHQLNGFNYPMEVHLVHKDSRGNLAVIGIIFKEGQKNEQLEKIIQSFPKVLNKEALYKNITVNPSLFFPQNKQFYKYSGSLTTPPCSEGVYWVVFKHPIEASPEQIQKMNEMMGDNYRPVQELNARSILKSWSDQPDQGASYEFYY